MYQSQHSATNCGVKLLLSVAGNVRFSQRPGRKGGVTIKHKLETLAVRGLALELLDPLEIFRGQYPRAIHAFARWYVYLRQQQQQ